MSVKLLTEQCLELPRLKGGYTGSSEATFVEMPQCWKSRVTAHMFMSTSLTFELKILQNKTFIFQYFELKFYEV